VSPDVVRDVVERIRQGDPREIQVQCPRGHFLVAVRLSVATVVGGESWLSMAPAVGRDHRWLRQRIAEHPEREGDPENYQYLPNGDVVWLRCRRCPNWKPTIHHDRLAVELAVYALAGHRTHRLDI
jgi:hypothetical protein